MLTIISCSDGRRHYSGPPIPDLCSEDKEDLKM